MRTIAKNIALMTVFAVTLSILFWVAPARAHAATYNYSVVNLVEKLPELKGTVDAVRVKKNWVFLTSAGTGAQAVTKLYTYNDQVSEVALAYPQKYDKSSLVITKMGNFYDNLTLTVARYAKVTDAQPADYHIFFADEKFNLWELQLDDSWIIKDMFFGPKTLTFLVGKKGTSEVLMYNYLWETKEKLLVNSFSGYDSVVAASNDSDEWVIRACTKTIADSCAWFTYSADKVLRQMEMPMAAYGHGSPFVYNASGYNFNLLTTQNGMLYRSTVDMKGLVDYNEVKLPVSVTAVNPQDAKTIELLWNTELLSLMGDKFISVTGNGSDRFVAVVNTKTAPQVLLYNAYDADKDGLSDDQEVRLGSSSATPDTDKDGISDFYEVTHNQNPNGVCQIKTYIPGDFKYGHGYVKDEVHQCYMKNFDATVQNALGKDWMTKYGVNWDKYADYVYGYIYGDYPINTLIGAIKRENGFSATVRYGDFVKASKK